MQFKIYNRKFILFFIFLIIVLCGINFLMDPFNVFGFHHRLNIYKVSVDKNQRVSKIPALKMYKNNVDAIWVGSSKTGWNTNESYESYILNKNIRNMTLNDCSFDEAITMAKKAVLIHPEIKTVYFGLDFAMMLKSKKDVKNEDFLLSMNLTKDEIFPLLLSFDSLEASFSTFYKNLKKNKGESFSYGEEKQYCSNIEHKFKNTLKHYYIDFYKNFEFDDKKIEELKELKMWLKNKDVELVLFTTTMHITERMLINDSGKLYDFYSFKEKLATVQPYWDFAIIDGYTTDKIKPDMQYFRDAIHPYAFLRKKISKRLFGLKEDFGLFVTKETIKKLNEIDKKRFDIYIKQNQELTFQVKKWCEY